MTNLSDVKYPTGVVTPDDSQWVRLVASLGVGTSYYLDPTSGNDSYDGKSPAQAKATLKAAYALMTANKNDVLYYMGGATALTLPADDAEFNWNKAMTHFVGICAPTRIGQRARIFNTAGTENEPMLTISGNGCHWENIYGFNGVADSGALTCLKVTADYGSMYNCQFVGGGSDESAIDGNSSLYMDGSANYTYKNCAFGAQSIPQGDGANVVKLGTTAGGQNIFDNCWFHTYASNGGACWIEALSGASTDRWIMFENCKFYNWGSTSLTSGAVLPAAGNGVYFFKDCFMKGATKWDASDRGVCFGLGTGLTSATDTPFAPVALHV